MKLINILSQTFSIKNHTSNSDFILTLGNKNLGWRYVKGHGNSHPQELSGIKDWFIKGLLNADWNIKK